MVINGLTKRTSFLEKSKPVLLEDEEMLSYGTNNSSMLSMPHFHTNNEGNNSINKTNSNAGGTITSTTTAGSGVINGGMTLELKIANEKMNAKIDRLEQQLCDITSLLSKLTASKEKIP